MTSVLGIAADLLREAASRKWFLALGAGITLGLCAIALGLRFDVVDGALAATRFFGEVIRPDIRAADVALRPVFRAAAYVTFYGGLAFGIVACADFGPSLLSPGRIEHLLALPVRRWELLAGTLVGVVVLATLGSLYGAGGLAVIMGLKTGVWSPGLVLAGLIASGTFVALYAAMLCAAVFVRSAGLSAAVGGALFVAGIVAGYRASVTTFFEPGVGRALFRAASLLVPRVSALADAASLLAASQPVERGHLAALVGGAVVFGLSMLALAIWHFERKDY